MEKEKHYLETISWNVIGEINYRGCLIKKIIGGWRVFDKHNVSTPQEVDRIIDEAAKELENSISDKSAQKT